MRIGPDITLHNIVDIFIDRTVIDVIMQDLHI